MSYISARKNDTGSFDIRYSRGGSTAFPILRAPFDGYITGLTSICEAGDSTETALTLTGVEVPFTTALDVTTTQTTYVVDLTQPSKIKFRKNDLFTFRTTGAITRACISVHYKRSRGIASGIRRSPIETIIQNDDRTISVASTQNYILVPKAATDMVIKNLIVEPKTNDFTTTYTAKVDGVAKYSIVGSIPLFNFVDITQNIFVPQGSELKLEVVMIGAGDYSEVVIQTNYAKGR
jgi:hypothetical protein